MERQSDASDNGPGSGRTSLSGDQGTEEGLMSIRQQLQLCASTLQQLAGNLAVSLPVHTASPYLSPVVSRDSSQ